MSLTEKQLDALKELINIGVGRGASVLNSMLNSHVHLSVPSAKIVSRTELKNEIRTFGGDRLASVELPFKGTFSGNTKLMFPTESASQLVSAIVGEEIMTTTEMDSVRAGTLCEVGNIVLNGVMGSIANILGLEFIYSVPTYLENTVEDLLPESKVDSIMTFLTARTIFKVKELNIDGNIILFFKVGSFDALIEAIDKLISDE